MQTLLTGLDDVIKRRANLERVLVYLERKQSITYLDAREFFLRKCAPCCDIGFIIIFLPVGHWRIYTEGTAYRRCLYPLLQPVNRMYYVYIHVFVNVHVYVLMQ